MCSIHKDYRYEVIPDGYIRILTILARGDDQPLKCRLDTYAPNQAPPFYAISHCWGSYVPSRALICNDKRVAITPQLFSALKTIHYLLGTHTELVLWVDAVCINQQNAEEKSKQVASIDKVFLEAHEVLVWLGEAENNSDEALQYIPRLCSRQSLGKLPRQWLPTGWPSASDPIWDAFGHLCCRSWFTRLWVLQEIALPNRMNIRAICGKIIVPFYHLVALHIVLSNTNCLSLITRSLTDQQKDVINGGPWNAIRYIWHSDITEWNTSNILCFAPVLNCTEPEDRVYGLLGLFPKGVRDLVTVDYGRVIVPPNLRYRGPRIWKPYLEESLIGLYTMIIRLSLLTEGTLAMLNHVSYTRNSGLPSWCFDLTRRSDYRSTLEYAGNPMCLKKRDVDTMFFYHAGIHPDGTVKTKDISFEATDNPNSKRSLGTIRVQGVLVDEIEDVLPMTEWATPYRFTTAGNRHFYANAQGVTRSFDLLQEVCQCALRAFGRRPDRQSTHLKEATTSLCNSFRRAMMKFQEVRHRAVRVYHELLPCSPSEWQEIAETLAGVVGDIKITAGFECSKLLKRMLGDSSQNRAAWTELSSTEFTCLRWYLDQMEHLWHRRQFFTTKGGRLGACSELAQPGDKIVILFGGRSAYILKPYTPLKDGTVGHSFQHAAYLHGMMNMEVFDMLERGKVGAQFFLIQ